MGFFQTVFNSMCGYKTQAMEESLIKERIYINGCLMKIVQWGKHNLLLVGGISISFICLEVWHAFKLILHFLYFLIFNVSLESHGNDRQTWLVQSHTPWMSRNIILRCLKPLHSQWKILYWLVCLHNYDAKANSRMRFNYAYIYYKSGKIGVIPIGALIRSGNNSLRQQHVFYCAIIWMNIM